MHNNCINISSLKTTIKNVTFLLLLASACSLFAGDISIGFGSNIQMHRTRVFERGLSFQEVDRKYPLSPSIFTATKLNKRVELSADFSYVKYNKSYLINKNFNQPNIKDQDKFSYKERVPFIMLKVNYNIYQKKKLSVDVSTGLLFSFQPLEQVTTADFKSNDSSILINYKNNHAFYSKANCLLGVQTKLYLSKYFDLRINVFNVFGNRQFIFKDTFIATDTNNNTRKLEYGLFGGFSCLDFKLVYKLQK